MSQSDNDNPYVDMPFLLMLNKAMEQWENPDPLLLITGYRHMGEFVVAGSRMLDRFIGEDKNKKLSAFTYICNSIFGFEINTEMNLEKKIFLLSLHQDNLIQDLIFHAFLAGIGFAAKEEVR